jgi:hypothetical protein
MERLCTTIFHTRDQAMTARCTPLILFSLTTVRLLPHTRSRRSLLQSMTRLQSASSLFGHGCNVSRCASQPRPEMFPPREHSSIEVDFTTYGVFAIVTSAAFVANSCSGLRNGLPLAKCLPASQRGRRCRFWQLSTSAF